MKILVTGGAGFIGSHLLDRLVRDGNEAIVIYDNLVRGRLENIAAHRDNPRVQFINGDLRDTHALRDAMRGAEFVFHLGAQSNVMGAVVNVDYSFQTNMVGTYNVLNAAKENGVRRVVFTSSREAYGEAQYLPVDENHPLASKNAYGASKAAGELYARVFYNQFGLETAVLRLANVYGTRDFDRVIPIWLDRARHNENLVVFGGTQLIDFVYVDQVVTALLRAAHADIIGQPINVGSGTGTPILELAQRILQSVPTTAQLEVQPARSAEVARFTAKVNLMQLHLALQPPDDPLFALPQLAEYYRTQRGISGV